ncbi:MAG: sulfatase family protein, partial [Cellulosilyticaceae bacterium]
YEQGMAADKGLLEQLTLDEVSQIRIGHTYDMIELVDWQIGEIIKTLKEEGIYEETILVFLSDHGELLGDHGLWRKGNALYEGLINIPFIVVDHVQKNQVSHQMVSTIDLVPTLCDLLEIEVPSYVDGKSVYAKEREAYCLVEYRPQADTCTYALISNQFKYIRYQNGEHELTALKEDPEERINQVNVADYQAIVLQMQRQLLDQLIKNYPNRTQKQFAY